MNGKKILKATVIMGFGAFIGYIKGVADAAYNVHKGTVDAETLDSFCNSVDRAKERIHGVTETAEEAVEDVAEEVTEAVEDTVEAVEEAVENQPED